MAFCHITLILSITFFLGEVMKVSLSQLKSNPHRNIENYPINEDKVQELIKSYENTEYWGNIICRKVGDHYEIAFGHHRLEALRRMKFQQVEVIVKKLDDGTMLKMMADENSESWSSNASIDQETVKAVVLAHSRGQIDLGLLVGPKTKNSVMLVAPSFLKMSDPDDGPDEAHHKYTAKCVALFLGWTKKDPTKPDGTKPSNRFTVAWHCLELIEDERFNLTDEDFRGLSRTQAEALARETVAAAKAWQTEQRMQEAKRKAAEKEAERAEKAGLLDAADKAKLKAVEAANAVKKAEATSIKDANKVKAALKKGFDDGLGVKGAKDVANSVKTERVKPSKMSGKDITGFLIDQSAMVRCMFNPKIKDRTKTQQKMLDVNKYALEMADDIEAEPFQNYIKNLRALAQRCEDIANDFESKL
jgi:ParB-like chromosome segregation protein Spo0J